MVAVVVLCNMSIKWSGVGVAQRGGPGAGSLETDRRHLLRGVCGGSIEEGVVGGRPYVSSSAAYYYDY